MTRLAFITASFLGSALLFAVQPIVVRMLLPSLGGSPAVWNTAMVFFQALLLAGYLYAHGSLRFLGIYRHRYLHGAVMLLPLAFLPIAVPAGWIPPADHDPTFWTIMALTMMVGAPYFALATASPTLQHWFANARGNTKEPYMLYAAGNAGSVMALLSYPFLVEPLMGIRQQAFWWAVFYGMFLVMLAICSGLVRNVPAPRGAAGRYRTGGRLRAKWISYAAVPSVLLLGVTRHIGDEIASFPLLWIVPLALYLATFIITFGKWGHRVFPLAARIARLLVIPAVLSLFRVPVPLPLLVAVHLVFFTALALVLHQRLYDSRPEAANLTEFYVFMSLGGALGGVFVVLVSPFVFDAVYEYPLAIAAALLALPRDQQAAGIIARIRASRVAISIVISACLLLALLVGWQVAVSDFIESNARLARLFAGVAGLLAYIALDRPRHFALVFTALLLAGVVVRPEGTVLQERSFFGVLRVQQIGNETTLFHGTTIHGSQRNDIPGIAQGYYHPEGPAGSVISQLQAQTDSLSVGIVGLGVGALAATGRDRDTLVFYEIDPAVIEIAADSRYFSYLSGSRAEIRIEVGDGRLLLDGLDARHDLLVIDAFSSDAIPVHLLTKEAFELYGRVSGGSPVIMHISNRHLNLAPVVGATARAAGLNAWIWEYDPDLEALATGARSSRWVLMSPEPEMPLKGWWESTPGGGDTWTDDYSNIIGAFEPNQ